MKGYLIVAHGKLVPNSNLTLGHNQYIVFMSKPGYALSQRWLMSRFFTEPYFHTLLPGFSGKKPRNLDRTETVFFNTAFKERIYHPGDEYPDLRLNFDDSNAGTKKYMGVWNLPILLSSNVATFTQKTKFDVFKGKLAWLSEVIKKGNEGVYVVYSCRSGESRNVSNENFNKATRRALIFRKEYSRARKGPGQKKSIKTKYIGLRYGPTERSGVQKWLQGVGRESNVQNLLVNLSPIIGRTNYTKLVSNAERALYKKRNPGVLTKRKKEQNLPFFAPGYNNRRRRRRPTPRVNQVPFEFNNRAAKRFHNASSSGNVFKPKPNQFNINYRAYKNRLMTVKNAKINRAEFNSKLNQNIQSEVNKLISRFRNNPNSQNKYIQTYRTILNSVPKTAVRESAKNYIMSYLNTRKPLYPFQKMVFTKALNRLLLEDSRFDVARRHHLAAASSSSYNPLLASMRSKAKD